ncbi:MAG: DUF488 domain-containing protein [Methylovulum sp.]|nr:DUF488 domain-containing protein [Methylovulum sp.]
MKIYTVGYEGHNFDSFLSLLAENDIETIVDVREIPLSRKPNFSKKSLEAALNISGREYVHMGILGCPKPVRDKYRLDGDWKRYTKGFMKHLATQDAAVAELSALASTTSCALLCFEADPRFCHRSMVANALEQQFHARVQHLHARNLKIQNFSVEPTLAAA